MRIVVDRDVCMSHGQCEFAAPNVFSLDDEGLVRYPEILPDERLGEVEEAVAGCPTQAIRVEP